MGTDGRFAAALSHPFPFGWRLRQPRQLSLRPWEMGSGETLF